MAPKLPDSPTTQLAYDLVSLYENSSEENPFKHQADRQNFAYNHEKVGAGKSSYVVSREKARELTSWADRTNPLFNKEVVYAIDYRDFLSPAEAKTLFYLQRILCTLFPHNFPRFYASYGSLHPDQPSGTIRERIYPSTNAHPFIKYRFAEVVNTLKAAGLYDGFSFETSWFNLTTAENGGQYYLDRPNVHKGLLSLSECWTDAKMLAFLRASDYLDRDQEVVLRLLARIQDLSFER